MISNDDTIAAIATANGEGGIAIVRISGRQALTIADQVFRCPNAPPSQRPTHTVTWGHIVEQGRTLDEGLLVVMRAPQSYTREDVVELQCHGGVVTPRQVLHTVLLAGARMAEPGEFTYRAFINGRLDLPQAEAVNDLIRSRSERAARLAVEQMDGTLSKQFKNIYRNLIALAAELEVVLDFTEEELSQDVAAKLIRQMETAGQEIGGLLTHWQDGHRIREGLSVVITGRPNVGKSSLLNALLGKERAIVSHHPGTTRDVIEESYYIEGVQLRLIDTAGLHRAEGSIEQEGIRRTYEQIQKADLYLYVLDASTPLHPEDSIHVLSLPPQRCLLILNKIDLGMNIVLSSLFNNLRKVDASSFLGIGLEEIKQEILEIISHYIHLQSMPETIISERHYHLLNRARHEIRDSLYFLKENHDELLAAHHIRNAVQNIGNIIGNDITDDILSSVFSKFCVGK